MFHMLTKWWESLKGNNLHTWLLKTIPCFILWNIQKSKCKARFDICEINNTTIISNIQSNIIDLYNAHKLLLTKGNSTPTVDGLTFFKLSIVKKQCIKQMVEWSPPRAPWVEINTDGASKGNSGIVAAGEVLRNSNRNLIGSLLSTWIFNLQYSLKQKLFLCE